MKKHSFLSLEKLTYLFSFLSGFFVVSPILTFKIAGRHISFFTLFFLLFFLSVFFLAVLSKSLNFSIGKFSKAIVCFFLISLLSSFVGLIYFSDKYIWFQSILRYIPKIVLFTFFTIFLSSCKGKSKIAAFFLSGFFIGCVINLIWTVLEGLFFKIFGFSMNNILFADYVAINLPANRQFVSIIRDGGIRASGFNYDPAHIGGIAPIIVMFSIMQKRFFLLMLGVLAIIFSQSTTSLVVSLLLIITSSLIKRNLIIKYVANTKFACFLITFTILLITFTNTSFINSIFSNSSVFIERISDNYIFGATNNIRTLYHLFIPSAIFNSNIKILTGVGFGVTSYPYVLYSHPLDYLNLTVFPYDPESTYITYLFGVGIFGLLLYLYIITKTYIYFTKRSITSNNALLASSLGAIIFSGLFYHYTVTAYQILIIIFSAIIMETEKH